MISCLVRVSDAHRYSDSFSLQQEHIQLHAAGSLFCLEVRTKDDEIIGVYSGKSLDQVIGEAVAKGRRTGKNQYTGAAEFYYLARR